MEITKSPAPWRFEPAAFQDGAFLVFDANNLTICTVWPQGDEAITKANAELIVAAANAVRS